MRPTKLSAKIFLELPPVLAHYVEGERSQGIELNPRRGQLRLLERPGVFTDMESLAVERRHLVEILGMERARALRYRTGFEQGRRDAQRHYAAFEENARLALQSAQVFGQLQGRFIAESLRFELDLEARTLYGELLLHTNHEALSHRLSVEPSEHPVCWTTAGYLAGHISEIVARRVITIETECAAKGNAACRFVSKLDPEWGPEADWTRQALKMPTVQAELAQRDELVAAARRELYRVHTAFNDLNRRLRSELMLENLVAGSPVMEAVLQRARMVMASPAPVLLTGERGTGRSTLARAIHAGSPRKAKPFVAVDCLGLTPLLLTQELIGFAQDAVPGAARAYAGALERSHGGTVYLNEICNLSLEAQGHMLRVLRDGVVTPIGAEAPVKTDVRIIAATQHNPLERMEAGSMPSVPSTSSIPSTHDPLERVAAGGLREDLYYALAIARIDLPPLRDRGDDIPRLAELFLREAVDRYQRPGTCFSREFKQALLECSWPGNVRHLRNVIEHAVVISQGGELGIEHLPEDVLGTRLKSMPNELSPETLRSALKRAKGNRTHAARFLNIGRTTLWRAMKRMGIE